MGVGIYHAACQGPTLHCGYSIKEALGCGITALVPVVLQWYTPGSVRCRSISGSRFTSWGVLQWHVAGLRVREEMDAQYGSVHI